MADTDILVSEMTPASQINTTDLMIMTQPDAQAETGYSTKSGTVLQVANKMLKGTEYSTDLPDFTDKTPLGGLEELKADIKSLLPIATASGNPCNFETGIADKLVSLSAEILASGGGGTPSTPIPIVGISSLDIVRCGKNLLPNLQGARTATSIYIGQTDGTTYPIFLKGGVNYHLSFGATGTSVIAYYKTATGSAENISSTGNFSVSEDMYVQIWLYSVDLTSVEWFQLELGSTATAYEPYNGQTFTIDLDGTRYGGTYTNDGKLRVTHGFSPLSSAWTWAKSGSYPGSFYAEVTNVGGKANTPFICTHAQTVTSLSDYVNGCCYCDGSINIRIMTADTTIQQWKDYIDAQAQANTPICICYELATPIEIDVSPISVDAVVGTNNITSNGGGDVTAQYRDSIQHYIDSKIASVQALIL